ncbi:unnamed protein product [Prunus armeniaca]
MPTLRLRLQEPFDLTNPTVRSRPNSRDMCPSMLKFCPTRLGDIRTVGARIAAQVGLVSLESYEEGGSGQLGHLYSAPARCRTSIGFSPDSKVEFGSGPVNLDPQTELEEFLIPAPVSGPVEQLFVGGPSGAAPAMPIFPGDPNFQHTLVMVTQQ